MNTQLIEEEIAYLLVIHATDHMENVTQNPEDLDAAVCAVLARALEVASNRTLKPLYEIFEATQPLWHFAAFYAVWQASENRDEQSFCGIHHQP